MNREEIEALIDERLSEGNSRSFDVLINEEDDVERRLRELEESKVDRSISPETEQVIHDTRNRKLIIGAVAGNGSTSYALFPEGWSAVKNATGDYTITHNIGHTDYAPVATPVETSARSLTFSSVTSTDIDIKTFDAAGSAADAAFWFHIIIS